jgi:ribosomal protein S18 acetylase RimI-like enzyme
VPAHESLSDLQFQYRPPEMGSSAHQLIAISGAQQVGTMKWNAAGVQSLEVSHELRRRGVATALWGEGQRLAQQKKGRIVTPKHSAQRTNAGDAWARSVGGPLPRRDRR